MLVMQHCVGQLLCLFALRCMMRCQFFVSCVKQLLGDRICSDKAIQKSQRGLCPQNIPKSHCNMTWSCEFFDSSLCAQDVDVEWFMRQWEGQYSIQWQSAQEVIVRFATGQALKEALTALGGGIRGVFRVDRGCATNLCIPIVICIAQTVCVTVNAA